jgi:hypothetical protein
MNATNDAETTSTGQSPWQTDSTSAGQQLRDAVWSPNVYYRVYINQPLNSILSQINRVQNSLLLRSVSTLFFNVGPGLAGFLFGFSVWNVLCLSNLSYGSYLSCPSHSPWLAILMCGEFWNLKRHENILNNDAISVFLRLLVETVFSFC